MTDQEQQQITETWELFLNVSVNMTKLRNILRALVIRIEIGDGAGEATGYGNLEALFESLGKYDKAKEHLEKALGVKIEINW